MTTSVHELTWDEYQATFEPPMLNVTESAKEFVDLWPYANLVIKDKYHGCAAWEWDVKLIYETPDGSYQHVYIPVPKDDTYLNIVVDTIGRRVVGHIVLDLRALCPDWVKKHDN